MLCVIYSIKLENVHSEGGGNSVKAKRGGGGG